MSQSYEFVPFVDFQEFNEKDFDKNGTIKLRIETLSYLHMGSGEYTEKAGLIYRTFLKTNGIYTIPGSSLKGCIRTLAEMVSHGCMAVLPQKEVQDKIPVRKTHSFSQSCILCDMFGTRGKKSKVLFSDFKATEISQNQVEIIRVAKSYTPNVNAQIYKDSKGQIKGYKVYLHGRDYERGEVALEAIRPGTVFEGEVIYQNLSDTQLKLLCFALGLSGLDLKIGYGKNHNLGSIRITAVDEFYKQKAFEYEKISDKNIQNNIKKLKEVLKFK